MSGITGIWNRDGEPVDQRILAAMSARLSHRGPDGETFHIGGAVGFAHQTLRITPESRAEVHPAVHASGSVLLWDGRLDNREELIAALVQQPGVNAQAPDTILVHAAYAALGNDFLKHLNGDFALALYDPSRLQLLLACDAMRGRPLYYCRFGDHFLFASEIKAVLAHPAVRTAPNDYRLAEWLFRIPDYAAESQTFFQDISTVPLGSVVTVDPQAVRLHRYWDFDLGRLLRLKTYPDYVEAYRAAFARAVQRRLRSDFPVAITVSGGMDSSSIYCMAQQLAGRNDTPGIVGIGFVGEHPAANEAIYQRAIEEHHGTSLLKIPLEVATTGAEGIDADAWHGEGPLLKWDAWHTLYRMAARHGARVTLTGYFGDHLLVNPQYLLDLLTRGRWLTAWRHLQNYYGWWGELTVPQRTYDAYALLRGYVVPARLRPRLLRLRRWLQTTATLPRPAYSDSLNAWARRVNEQRSPLHAPPGSAHAQAIYHHVHSRLQSHPIDLKADARFSLETNCPFRDRDLVALVMSIPGEMVYQSGYRGIHRDAMQGILPEKVRTRITKTPYQHPAKLGAIKDFDQFRPRLEKGTAARLEYLAPGSELSRILDDLRAELDADETSLASWLALDLLGLEGWLSAFFGGKADPPELSCIVDTHCTKDTSG